MYKQIYISLIVAASVIYGCSSENKGTSTQDNKLPTDIVNNPATASPDAGKNQDKVPAFKFDSDTHDFGSIAQGEKVSFAFKFTNTGKTDLLIREAHASCGCTVPSFPKTPIPPGGQGTIDVTFNSEGKSGMQHKEITVVANTIPNTKVLVITGEVVDPRK
jgi:hypothetical protein